MTVLTVVRTDRRWRGWKDRLLCQRLGRAAAATTTVTKTGEIEDLTREFTENSRSFVRVLLQLLLGDLVNALKAAQLLQKGLDLRLVLVVEAGRRKLARLVLLAVGRRALRQKFGQEQLLRELLALVHGC